MDSTLLVLLSLGLGLAVGVGFTLLLVAAVRQGGHAAEVSSRDVPDGVDQVLDALDSAAVVVDPSNTVVKFSPGAAALGLVFNQALVHAALVELVDGVRRSGDAVSKEVVVARGPLGDASVHLFVHIARLGVRYILLVAEDRTESYRLDDVRRDFVANISHELKTPIGAVGLLAEALHTAADEPLLVRRFADRLSVESTRLARITREIIELSRLQADDALSRPELVEVDAVIASAIDQNRVAALAKGVDLAGGGKRHLKVYGDEAMLVVAVHNLVANAVHYSPNGSRVGVGVKQREGIVEISVTDQGMGIAPEDIERVFERFFRVDQARARNTGGTGLGLSIVKHAVQNHGGDISVWSQLGQGSTFTMRLPEASIARASALGVEFAETREIEKEKR